MGGIGGPLVKRASTSRMTSTTWETPEPLSNLLRTPKQPYNTTQDSLRLLRISGSLRSTPCDSPSLISRATKKSEGSEKSQDVLKFLVPFPDLEGARNCSLATFGRFLGILKSSEGSLQMHCCGTTQHSGAPMELLDAGTDANLAASIGVAPAYPWMTQSDSKRTEAMRRREAK